MSEEKRGPGGRPTLYKPEYCDMVVEHMAQGASLTSFAASIKTSRSVITVWMNEHPEFLRAAHEGKAACAAWWEENGRRLAKEGGAGASATLTVFGLKNMAPDEWRERQQIEHTGKDGGPMQNQNVSVDLSKLTDEELEQLEKIQAKLRG